MYICMHVYITTTIIIIISISISIIIIILYYNIVYYYYYYYYLLEFGDLNSLIQPEKLVDTCSETKIMRFQSNFVVHH